MATSEYQMVAYDYKAKNGHDETRLVVWPPAPGEECDGGTIVLQPGDRIPDGTQDLIGSEQGYGRVFSANALPGQKEPNLTAKYRSAVALYNKQERAAGGQPAGDDGDAG